MSTAAVERKPIRSTIPARLDRLSSSPFHTRMLAGLGAAWILDGLQITIASSVYPVAAGVAAIMGVCSFSVAMRRPSPASLHRRTE